MVMVVEVVEFSGDSSEATEAQTPHPHPRPRGGSPLKPVNQVLIFDADDTLWENI